jgi:molecular chaperone GrpE
MENEKENKEDKKTKEHEGGCECGKECERKKKNAGSLEEQLEECKKQSEEYLNGWKRARADYLNYRNEETDRVGGMLNYAREEVISDILPVLDNFNLVIEKLPEDLLKDANVSGILQLKVQLEFLLKSYGVEEVKALGEKFDVNVHEVVQEVEAEGKESGIVVEEVKKGYSLGGRLLRPAKVKVAK